VQTDPGRGRQCLLDRLPGQLVAEVEDRPAPDEQSAFDALVDRVRSLGGHLAEKVELDATADDRRGVEHASRRRGEPGRAREGRVPHGRRQHRTAGREHLGHEERIALGTPEQLLAVDRRSGVVRETPHRRPREPWDVDPLHPRTRREVAQHDGQRMGARHLVVPERPHDQDGKPVEPASEEAEQVQGRLVRPVQVLQHEKGRGRGEGGADRGERPHAGLEQVLEIGQCVQEGAERSRRRRTVRRTPQDPDTRRRPGEPAGQCRLAHAGLAADEHQAPRPSEGHGEMSVERGEQGVPLQEHTGIETPSSTRHHTLGAAAGRPDGGDAPVHLGRA
jgi:hypothetical protein